MNTAVAKGCQFLIILTLLTGVSLHPWTAFADAPPNTPTTAQTSSLSADPEGRRMMQDARRIIADYHNGQPGSKAVLRVVYFVPKDGEPFPNYTERLNRTINDVSQYYRDGLRRFGMETEGLPLERKDGKLVFHMVKGQLPASEYHYDSGGATREEIRLALKGQVDIEREHVLVFYALSSKTDDGRYVFDAPYYGGGSQRNGLCHAADCELLDPLLLMATNQPMVFTEHYYPRLEATVARFNSMYLGGVAHELGHGIGLPHDDGGVAEKSFGISLMGTGNVTYRQEIWGGGPPTYLGRASALMLASHPLFTGSDRGRWDVVQGGFKSLVFSATNSTLTIHGSISDAIPPYAVIGYVWPETDKVDDHVARTYPCVLKDGAFTLNVDGISTSNFHRFHLILRILYANGAAASQSFPLSYSESSVPNADTLNAEWITDRAELAVMRAQPEAREFLNDAALAAAPTPEAESKLRLLRSVINSPTPVDLSAVKEDSVFVSDAIWSEAKVGWGQVTRNHFSFGPEMQNGVFLTLGGKFYDKGLYAHSPSRFVFPTARKWKTFIAKIGLRDGAHIQGSAVFTVRGDGRELYRSRILRVGEQEDVKLDIANVAELELVTEGGEGHNHNSWAIWAAAKVQR